VFISYRKKRDYDLARIEQVEQVSVQYNPLTLLVAGWRLPRRSSSSCGWTR
jgi:hypothetical protein